MFNCHTCSGTKKIRQLGMMLADCPVCDGTGKLTAEQYAATRVAAHPEPLTLPDDFYQAQRDAQASKLKNANVAHLNRPIEIKSQQQAPSLDLHGNPIAAAIPSSGGLGERTLPAPNNDLRTMSAMATFENEVKVARVEPTAPVVPATPASMPPVAKTSGSKK